MIKNMIKGKLKHFFLKILLKMLPVILPIIFLLFTFTLIAEVLSDFNFWSSEDYNDNLLPIEEKTVEKYKKYENGSISKDKTGYEKIYSKETKTDDLIDSYPSISELDLDEKNKITIERSKITRPYRSYYELLSALEIVSGEKKIQKIDKAEDFKSIVEFTDNENKYYESEFVVVKTYYDGDLEKEKSSQTDYITVRPTGQLKSVSTIFCDIEFEYEKVIVNETSWERTTSTKNSIINRNEKNVIKKVVTTTYKRSKDEVYILKREIKLKNSRLENFITKNFKNKMLVTDLIYVYEYGSAFENSSDFKKAISAYLEPEGSYSFEDIYIGESSMTEYVGGDMIWPGGKYKKISSPFGYRIHPISKVKKLHTGIDVAIPYGEKIYAAQSGEVIFSARMGGYGNAVIVDHGGGISTLYAHNSKLLVMVGQMVESGQEIAECGSTGNSTGPHLHFEVRNNGEYKNPFEYIKKKNR